MSVVRDAQGPGGSSRTTLSMMILVTFILLVLVSVTVHYSGQLKDCYDKLYSYEKGPGKYIYMENYSTPVSSDNGPNISINISLINSAGLSDTGSLTSATPR